MHTQPSISINPNRSVKNSDFILILPLCELSILLLLVICTSPKYYHDDCILKFFYVGSSFWNWPRSVVLLTRSISLGWVQTLHLYCEMVASPHVLHVDTGQMLQEYMIMEANKGNFYISAVRRRTSMAKRTPSPGAVMIKPATIIIHEYWNHFLSSGLLESHWQWNKYGLCHML